MKLTTFPGGVLLGLGLMYFLDPIRGRRRRARINEAVLHAQKHERDLLQKAARDAKQRAHGMIERAKHRPSPDAPDQVVESRVRACLGRAVSHPGALDLVVHDGRVILRGPVFTNEGDFVVRAVQRVAGVREVVDRMERHDTADSVPSLQGVGRSRRRRVWSPTKQVAATGAGAALLGYGLLMRRGLVGALVGAAGGALLLRGTVNRPMPELVGRGGGVTVQKTILISRPVHDVFELASKFDNFPQFMEHVREVELSGGGKRSRWTVDGPASTKVEFEAEITQIEPDRLIAWKTLPNQPIEHEGRVRFEDAGGGATRVHVRMTYRPPGGIVGHAIAHILGWDPKARMDDDMIRLKALLEEGKTRAHHERIELADLH